MNSKKYKVMLVNPPIKGLHKNANYGVFPTIGIVQLGTRVKNELEDKVSIFVLDAAVIEKKEIENRILDYRPNLIGFSVLTTTYPEALRLAKTAKIGDAKVVLGNDNASFAPDLILTKRQQIDYIITNDVAETPFIQLVEHLLGTRKITNVDSLVYRSKSGKIKKNPQTKYNLKDVNTIPDLKLLLNQLDIFSDNYMGIYGHLHNRTIRPVIINNARGCKNWKRKCEYCNILDLRINLGKPEQFWKIVRRYYNNFGINFFY